MTSVLTDCSVWNLFSNMIVNKGTRGPEKILDVVVTNLDVYYDEPEIVPPIDVDEPAKGGVPSDSSGVVVDRRNKHGTVQKVVVLFTRSVLL